LIWGIVTGTIIGGILILNVKSQPSTRKEFGIDLLVNLTWAGIAYGMIDALLLNIMPVLAIHVGLSQYGWTSSWTGKFAFGLTALAASLWITLAYHAGYKEFRNRSMAMVLFGNTIITLAYLISGNPLGALIAHTVMHMAAVLQGPETTLQLPPHADQPI
jgi:hypothetical protein